MIDRSGFVVLGETSKFPEPMFAHAGDASMAYTPVFSMRADAIRYAGRKQAETGKMQQIVEVMIRKKAVAR